MSKPFRIKYPVTAFTPEDTSRASEAWGCNCGPGALAAILGLTLDDVRPHIPNFEQRHYTNPSMMESALRSLGVGFRNVDDGHDRTDGILTLPAYGLVRVQWDGPWMRPKPGRERWALMDQYKHTHWIATARLPDMPDPTMTWVFDINFGWTDLDWWADVGVKEITSWYPKATAGVWLPTHRWELIFPGEKGDTTNG
ncbi:hypothetical protein [Geminisphaera colitermitum]|uniref:hypothetical protein n=1 Tax=Geminisphaera colitermitum TaxID=1148786 RepID=UPI000158C710|nr:hypothetical protein [Geminisphaera colitermitum]